MKILFSLVFSLLAFTHLQGNNINWTSPPTMISGANINAVTPVLAMDASGNTVAAWIENSRVKSSTHPVNGNWSSEVNVSGTGAASPCLVLDASGNATLIWIGSGVIYASTKTLTGSWSSATALSNSGATSPVLGIGSAGDVVAAWVRSGNIESTTKLSGANWQTRTTITTTSAANPSISVGGTGANKRAVVVWQGISSGTPVIFTATKLLSSGWTNPSQISNAMHNATNPKVAVDSSGNAIAVWYEYDITALSYTNVTVQSSERVSLTGTWNNATALSLPGIRNPSSLCANIAFDSFGNAVAVWNTSFDDETFNIQSAVKPVNSQWSSVQDIADSNLYAYNESISVTKFGDTLGLYMYYNGTDLLIQSIESNSNGYANNVWSVPITISLSSDNAHPKIAATYSNNMIYTAAIWSSFDGVYDTVVAATGSKTLLLPPTNLGVTQGSNDFGVFTVYSNTLNWNASTDPHTVAYLIFRNGLFIDQVDASALQYVDYNRVNNGSVTYSVTSVDAQQTQSPAVNVNFP